ncbi:MAG TPA: hypothetical protein VMI15_00130 [Burkholderiales bacterium]|nr:hypothetical protein [Burkholderiales bacterium]
MRAAAALMGFSHGGALTLLASTAWARETFAPGNAPGFRAFLAFYPNCNAEFPERLHLAAPLRDASRGGRRFSGRSRARASPAARTLQRRPAPGCARNCRN